MKNLKEKQLLVNLAKTLGQKADEEIVKELREFDQIKKQAKASVSKDPMSYILEAAQKLKEEPKQNTFEFPLPPSLDELEEMLRDVPELKPEEQIEVIEGEEIWASEVIDANEESLIEKTTKFISESPKESFQQPEPPKTNADITSIVNKLRYLEQWVSKISMTGPGGGAGDVITLNHPVTLVTGDYTVTRKDYYVGVNAPTTVNITLLDSIGFPGRIVIIKDESGNCSNNPIVVSGTVDNDVGGFILAQDNGGIQMIYREGWRII